MRIADKNGPLAEFLVVQLPAVEPTPPVPDEQQRYQANRVGKDEEPEAGGVLSQLADNGEEPERERRRPCNVGVLQSALAQDRDVCRTHHVPNHRPQYEKYDPGDEHRDCARVRPESKRARIMSRERQEIGGRNERHHSDSLADQDECLDSRCVCAPDRLPLNASIGLDGSAGTGRWNALVVHIVQHRASGVFCRSAAGMLVGVAFSVAGGSFRETKASDV